MGMSGGSWICQKRPTGLKKRVIIETHNLATEGHVCHKATPDFPKTKCVEGTECRPRPGQERMSGGSWICQKRLTKAHTAKLGEVCHKAIPNFPKTVCENGLECRPRPGQEMMKGGSFICQVMKIGGDTLPPTPKPALRIAKPGKVCHEAIPDFPKTVSTEGFECRPRPGQEMMSGGSYI